MPAIGSLEDRASARLLGSILSLDGVCLLLSISESLSHHCLVNYGHRSQS